MASGRMSGVEQFEQFEQGASAVGCGAVGDLADDDVLIETVELAHAARAATRAAWSTARRLNRPTVEAAWRGWPVRRMSRRSSMRGLSEFADEFDNAIAFDAFLRAEETVGKVFDGISGKLLQDVDQILGHLIGVDGFFDHLGQAIFDADAGAQILHQGRPLLGHAFERGAEFSDGFVLSCGRTLPARSARRQRPAGSESRNRFPWPVSRRSWRWHWA